jgi:O-antigen/teichoic acid export membrane protein
LSNDRGIDAMIKTSLANLILRGITLASKFLLLLFIARFLSAEELGIYGLVNVTVAISLYLLGMDFYSFNTREILAHDPSDRPRLIRDQFVFHGFAYIIILPLLLLVFIFGAIPFKYAVWFYALLVVEHLSQELSRLLITLSRPTMSSTVLLVRTGVWVYAAVATMYFWTDTRSLPVVWGFWIAGATASIVIALWALRHLDFKSAMGKPVDWAWLKRGLRVSLPFLSSTASLLCINYADRYFIQSFRGEAMVGVYTFYTGIANMVQVFVYTGIVMILFPRIVESFQQGQADRYAKNMRLMATGIIVGVAVLSGIAALLIQPALMLVGKELISQYRYVFWIMLGTVSALMLSYIPHYALYVRKYDRAIVISTIIALILALGANSVLVPEFGILGAAWSTFSAMVLLGILKTVWLVVVKRRDGRFPGPKKDKNVIDRAKLATETRDLL